MVASFPGHNGAPAFSPDGSKLAFASSQDGLLNIYVMSSNGGTPTHINSAVLVIIQNHHGLQMVAQPSLLQIEGGSPQVYRMSASGGGASPVGGRGSAKSVVMVKHS